MDRRKEEMEFAIMGGSIGLLFYWNCNIYHSAIGFGTSDRK